MTTTVRLAANGQVVLPEAFRKSKRLKPGAVLRVTEAGESILLTPVYPPVVEELSAVIDAGGGPGQDETGKTRKKVEAAIEKVRARKKKDSSRH
ncbi:MAG: AbrB/MazE/SpoVT family DNA-binding domain-containing protein [Verrucomicrobia bacterium]|nr:AbrB/MazE/SpoVT family DNA-binding domain-containing protein [Verrucomicrobiota bacterium]